MKTNTVTSPPVNCTNNVSQYARFTVTDKAHNTVEQYSLLALGPVASTDGRGLAAGVYVPLYTYVGTDLMNACAAPSNTTPQLTCGDTGEMYSNCPPPVPCEFNNATITLIGNPISLGNGSVQLARSNFGQSELSAFALCAQQQLPSIVTNEVTNAPVYVSAAPRRHKTIVAAAVLFAVSAALSHAL